MRVATGIVGAANIMLGDAVSAVLEALLEASPASFRGIPYSTARSEPEVQRWCLAAIEPFGPDRCIFESGGPLPDCGVGGLPDASGPIERDRYTHRPDLAAPAASALWQHALRVL